MSTKVFQNGHQGFSATTLDGDATSLFFAVQRSDAIDKHARAMFAQRPRRTTVATSRPPLPPVSSSSSKTITLCDDVSPPSPTDVSILRSFSGQRRGLTKVAPTTNNGGVNVNVYILSDVSVSDNVMTNLRLSFKEDNGHRVTIKHLCDEWSGFDPFGVNNKLLHPFLEEVRAQCHAQIVDCVVVIGCSQADAEVIRRYFQSSSTTVVCLQWEAHDAETLRAAELLEGITLSVAKTAVLQVGTMLSGMNLGR